MNPRLRSIAITTIKFVTPVVIIVWLLSAIDDEQWAALRSQPKHYGVLASAFLVALAALALTFTRWAILVRSQGIPLSMLDAYRLSAIGFLLNFVSAGSVGGDLFKGIFLARRSPGKRIEAVASIFVDRALGLYGLLLVVVAALAIVPPATASEDLQQVARGAAVLAAVGTVALVTLVVGGRWIDRLLRRLGDLPRVGALIHRVADPLRSFHRHPVSFLIALVLSLGVHSLLSISMYLVARGLYDAPPGFADHLIIVPVGMLASALPLTPAGMGILEATIDWLYRVVPAEPTAASGTLVALAFELVKLALASVGMVFYWSSGREVQESLDAIEDEMEEELDEDLHAADERTAGEALEEREQADELASPEVTAGATPTPDRHPR
ncbi:lysylphosphatidylglycerol synthase transmembrane domain-containing protein [Candidatus Laterigemmans baculatus]|uniref:lysylphosphatidylglycerol synthase transmembrane domain-containing protein n=1 Tax=Candidatus Laterigemmans baculatus TaxID=2770505 RepID=UPI0013DCD331|nr:lysylphosphatidylglycerol synthase transmembrane domain-containing protein [Candidatus Laterigemmans baculatus]